MGIDSGTLWYNTGGDENSKHKWYINGTLSMELTQSKMTITPDSLEIGTSGTTLKKGPQTATYTLPGTPDNGKYLTTDGSGNLSWSEVSSNQWTGTTDISYSTGNVNIAKSLFVGNSPTYGAVGEIRATNDITAYYASDKRLKENITPIKNSLEKIDKINGVTFDWTKDYINSHGGEDGYFIRKSDVGVIAQEIEEILPEVVAERKDGYKAVKYEKIVPLLIESIKELSDKNKILTNSNKLLDEKLINLQNENKQIISQISLIMEKLNK